MARPSAKPIEDYGLIGDLETAALVGRDGSIDWFCAPRFDSAACFASLLGTKENGYWRLAPAAFKSSSRQYVDNSLVLETRFETGSGAVTVTDFMPVKIKDGCNTIVRIVKGIRGRVEMHMELAIRFDYGRTIPWVRRRNHGIEAISGPASLDLLTPVKLVGRDFRTVADFAVEAGDEVPFVLNYRGSQDVRSASVDASKMQRQTLAWWKKWSAGLKYKGNWRDAVLRSLITLKALTHLPTGGIVAAPTTSLPESLGGERNWDYRYCWLRDATFTLYALLASGFEDEAKAWRDWLLRAVAGKPSQLQTLYGAAGERMLPEFEIDWLQGYGGSTPVRVGNLAHRQLQLDVYGEMMDAFHLSRRVGIGDTKDSWALQATLIDYLESGWKKPDNGIWEVRGRRRHFTHSKVMAWVALDRAIKAIEQFSNDGPLDRWKGLRDTIHAEVCEKGFDEEKDAFVQYYGSRALDASLLQIPLVGFLPPEDPRCIGTVAAVERELMADGFVRRYAPNRRVEGVSGREGVFLPCTYWLADNYAMLGQTDKATHLFEQLLEVRNDLGLLSEQYDPTTKRLLGNFPQAFSHVSLVNTAHNLRAKGPASDRASS